IAPSCVFLVLVLRVVQSLDLHPSFFVIFLGFNPSLQKDLAVSCAQWDNLGLPRCMVVGGVIRGQRECLVAAGVAEGVGVECSPKWFQCLEIWQKLPSRVISGSELNWDGKKYCSNTVCRLGTGDVFCTADCSPRGWNHGECIDIAKESDGKGYCCCWTP
nr:hypothetical protein [Tanacetum cinerariifolium]